MFGLGMGELLVILIIVLLVFGAGKLPQIGDALGKSIRNFKSAASGDNQLEVSKKKEITRGAARDATNRDDRDDRDDRVARALHGDPVGDDDEKVEDAEVAASKPSGSSTASSKKS